MKTKNLITILALLISGIVAFGQDKPKSVEKQSSSPKMEMAKDSVYYTCSMHPNVKSTKPGKCPICKIDLFKK